ncbi:hypothetical protein [Marmoricola endophyticus]|uniref:hypothetical protein n=1 Tax=Marmoricola endophyticus TaxID=2040280 RepID=UPI00166DC3CD|nr:hypothetical protein [Marmoricola endophyticus]
MTDYVGGHTDLISAGGTALGRSATAVAGTSGPLQSAGSSAAGATGDATATASLNRCGLAWSRLAHDLATQVEAIGRLADSTAKDLDQAGGA